MFQSLTKALYYDHTGVCVLAKRLEVGTFSWPRPSEPKQQQLSLTPQGLQLIFDGNVKKGHKNVKKGQALFRLSPPS